MAVDSMNGLINLLILYIIFTLVSSLFRKGKQPFSSGDTSKPADATRESRVRQSKTTPSSSTLRASRPPSKGSQEGEVPVRFTLPEKPEEIPLATVEETPPAFLSQEEEKPLHRKTTVSAHPRLLAFHHSRGYIQGIILSEILGPPVSKRKRS